MKIIKSILFPLYQKLFGGKGYHRKKYPPNKLWNPLHQKRESGANTILPDKIESKSLDLLKSYSLEKGKELGNYIDPIDILEHLGYNIKYVNGKYPSKGESAVYGALYKERKVVEINHDISFNEGMENFTVAHEIGHIILHAEEADQNRNKKTCSLTDNDQRSSVEKEADKFAAYLLMPTEKIKKVFNRVHGRPLYLKKKQPFYLLKKGSRRKSAIVFADKIIKEGGFTNVSKLAMVNRLISMGLIKGLPYQPNKRR